MGFWQNLGKAKAIIFAPPASLDKAQIAAFHGKNHFEGRTGSRSRRFSSEIFLKPLSAVTRGTPDAILVAATIESGSFVPYFLRKKNRKVLYLFRKSKHMATIYCFSKKQILFVRDFWERKKFHLTYDGNGDLRVQIWNHARIFLENVQKRICVGDKVNSIHCAFPFGFQAGRL